MLDKNTTRFINKSFKKADNVYQYSGSFIYYNYVWYYSDSSLHCFKVTPYNVIKYKPVKAKNIVVDKGSIKKYLSSYMFKNIDCFRGMLDGDWIELHIKGEESMSSSVDIYCLFHNRYDTNTIPYKLQYDIYKNGFIISINGEKIDSLFENMYPSKTLPPISNYKNNKDLINNHTSTFNNTCTHFIEPEMVYVEGGTFIMGCTDEQIDDYRKDETPAHSVTLSSFKISKYEITQKQWSMIMGENPYGNNLGDNYPITDVSWYDAQEFCKCLSELTGKQYRLPTEAEWEYAARGGNKSKGYKYSGSNNLDEVGWYIDNRDNNLNPVGEKLPNELGIYDMSGNVQEWCNDWYDFYFAEPQINPTGYSEGSSRVNRGGNIVYDAKYCDVTIRNSYAPKVRGFILGFRIVQDLQEKD
ncbi:MAG: formylglycine-generating enzyme family protein [Bacteroidales bacterium]|jgi:formylglycine-generating enzyme required for sulfatase activity|nr:formylglycine-generating enzyme family protein [Bacteroidales bacterium]